jgi:tetratricopeptide (TPR) repeat protein
MEEVNPIQRERDRKVVEILRNFLLATLTFRQQYEKYRSGSLHFSDLAKLVDDRGQSILFVLKESCHDLFRRGSTIASEKEQLFDLTIGSLFHLAMKMREDLYQLEIYGPKYLELSKKRISSQEPKILIRRFKEIISRAETNFQEGMEEIVTLFQDIRQQFKELLLEYRENGLLIRFLLEETDLLKEVLGPGTLEDFFRILYGEDEAQAYRLAGESYFQSAFYPQAVKAFSRALEKNPGDENLQFKFHLSMGMDQFYSFDPIRALESFEKCLSLSEKVEFLENYRAMIRKACLKIQEEFPGRRKSNQHRDLVKMAQVLQRQLEELPPAPSDICPL